MHQSNSRSSLAVGDSNDTSNPTIPNYNGDHNSDGDDDGDDNDDDEDDDDEDDDVTLVAKSARSSTSPRISITEDHGKPSGGRDSQPSRSPIQSPTTTLRSTLNRQQSSRSRSRSFVRSESKSSAVHPTNGTRRRYLL